MSKVVFHHLSIPYTEYGPDRKYFLNNSLIVAERADVACVERLPSREYLEFIKDIGLLLDDVKIIEYNKEATFCEISGPGTLDVYTTTDLETSLADRLGLSINTNIELNIKLESRDFFRKIVKKLNFKTPDYIILKKNPLKFFQVLALFFKFKKVFIRFDTGAGGYNGYAVTLWGFIVKIIRDRTLEPEIGVHVAEHKITAEQWFEPLKYRVGLHYEVTAAGELKHHYTHEVLVGKDKKSVNGSRSHHFLPESIVAEVELQGLEISKVIHSMGYRGHFNYDCLISETGSVIWLETNPRFGTGLYGHLISERLGINAADKPFTVTPYKHQSFINSSEGFILNHFKGRLFKVESKCGVIPFYFKPHLSGSCSVFESFDDINKVM